LLPDPAVVFTIYNYNQPSIAIFQPMI